MYQKDFCEKEMAPTFNQKALELASKQGKNNGRVSINVIKRREKIHDVFRNRNLKTFWGNTIKNLNYMIYHLSSGRNVI